MNVFRVGLQHVDEVANLFDQYRQFYKKSAEPEGCRRFIAERLANDESVIFAAKLADGLMAGFTQLYHSFCSVEMADLIYLYDLFVVPEARRQGVAKALMDAAQQHAIRRGASRLQLETATDNRAAQALYEGLGWSRDKAFYTYHLELDPTQVL
ncbi:MAG: GNAT family N-acetyltransferase [Woeseia sp.]